MVYNTYVHPVANKHQWFFSWVIAVLMGQSASIAEPLVLRSWMNQTAPLALLLL